MKIMVICMILVLSIFFSGAVQIAFSEGEELAKDSPSLIVTVYDVTGTKTMPNVEVTVSDRTNSYGEILKRSKQTNNNGEAYFNKDDFHGFAVSCPDMDGKFVVTVYQPGMPPAQTNTACSKPQFKLKITVISSGVTSIERDIALSTDESMGYQINFGS
jgi:hypothetical protein